MLDPFSHPLNIDYLLRKKKSIRKDLLSHRQAEEKRIAILGGSTTSEVKDMLEIFLLNSGIKPEFYESAYNHYYEDAIFHNDELDKFKPDLIYIHTSAVNISDFPRFEDSADAIDSLLTSQIEKFKTIWDRIETGHSCPVIQNNFEQPYCRGLGNYDGYALHGRSRFISELNIRFGEEARLRANLHLNDINYLSAWVGLQRWYDKTQWYSYKYAMSISAIPFLADSVVSIINAIFGKTKKCLVLDLDNTLWGGVIGDDGLEGIQIGNETAQSEAYTEFQKYVKTLKSRGVILAACSKNDEESARQGFSHPDSILSVDDFSVFKANWSPKHQNILSISKSLNIGMDSLVFVDDNPAERDIVRNNEPQVTVPEMGNSVADYIGILDRSGLFEVISLSTEDARRSAFYSDNQTRESFRTRFESYDSYLRSLEMKADINKITPLYLDRVTQLTNKTNQFNVTTRRYTVLEMEKVARDDGCLTLYGRLHDKFGDNGLVSVMAGTIRGEVLDIDLWLMSCRVLKRGMELAMFDQFVLLAQEKRVKVIYGYYYPTSKNKIVSQLFSEIGFDQVSGSEGKNTVWKLDISLGWINKNSVIEVN